MMCMMMMGGGRQRSIHQPFRCSKLACFVSLRLGMLKVVWLQLKGKDMVDMELELGARKGRERGG